MHGLVRRHPRYGYRRIWALLRADGWEINRKRVYRLWKREGFKVPRRRRKKRRLGSSANSCVRRLARWKDAVWAWDFIHNRDDSGRPLKWLSLVDEYTRECLLLKVDRSITSADKELNIPILFGVAGCAALWLMTAPIPRILVSASRPVAACMLEVYILHTYLFVRPSGYVALDLLITLACVVAVSWGLAQGIRVLARLIAPGQTVFQRRPQKAQGAPPWPQQGKPESVAGPSARKAPPSMPAETPLGDGRIKSP